VKASISVLVGLSVGLLVPVVAEAQNGHNCDRDGGAGSRNNLNSPAYLSVASVSHAESHLTAGYSPWHGGQASAPSAAKIFEISVPAIAAVSAETTGLGKGVGAPTALADDYVAAGIVTEEIDAVAGAPAELDGSSG